MPTASVSSFQHKSPTGGLGTTERCFGIMWVMLRTYFPGEKWGVWEFQPKPNLAYVKIPTYFGSKHFLFTKERGMFNFIIIIWSFVLYCFIPVYSLK